MKTISTIIREIFALRNNQKPLKFNQNETEIDENPGNPGVDYPNVGKTTGSAENSQESNRLLSESGAGSECEPLSGSELEQSSEPDTESRSEINIEDLTPNPVPNPNPKSLSNPDFAKAIEEAYQRGVIDGRNAKIEEEYFPKTNDGIPQFHGSFSKENSFGDIFSMAREA